MYQYLNVNPTGKSVGDCVVRALSLALDDSWEHIYADLTMTGRYMYDMPNSNEVWGRYLQMNGFSFHRLPDTCPLCYTVRTFVQEHPIGTYVVATGSHVLTVIDGVYYDTADTGNEVLHYYFRKEK